MSKVKSIFKRSLAILLAMLTIMSVGLTSAIALNLDMAQTAGYVDLAETGANTTVSDGSYRLYFKFANNTTWWNGSGCYHFAWVWGTNMTSQWRAIYKVGTTNNESDGSTSSVYYMDIPSGTLTGMKLIRGKTSTTVTNGSTTYGSPSYYNCTNDITLSNSISTYNLITGVTENSSTFTHNSRYTSVSVSSYGATVTNAQSGSGTTTDPYIVTPGQTMNVSATSSIADHNFKVGYGYNSSTQYTTTATGTVTASTTTGSTQSFTVYYTPLLGGSTTYRGTQSSKTIYYKVVDPAPSAPSSVKLEVLNAYAGTGTQADPYLVEPNATINTKITCVASDAANTTGFLYNVNYTAAWATGAAGETEFLYDGLAKLANGASGEYTPYAWAYNGTAANKSDMTTGEKVYIKAAYQNVTVQFVDYDGTVLDTQTIPYGGSATAPDDPTREGHSFSGWDKEFTNVTSNLVVTALYDIDTFTVTFKDRNGNTIDTQTVEWGTAATAPTAPDVPGMTFSRWDTDFSNVKSDLTVTAVYTEDEYSVDVATNGNGGTASANKTSGIKYGETVTLRAVADTANGYEFTGWSISGDFDSADNNFTLAEITIDVHGDVEATANFKLKEYEVSVTYDSLHSSSASASSATVEHGKTVTLTAEPDTLNGVQFAGWEIISGTYTITSGDLDSTSVTITVASDITAKAKFTQLDSFTYTVSASPAEGGSVLPESNIVFDGSSVVFTAVANTGYVFENWTIVSDETYNVISGNVDLPSIGIIPHANVIVTANFAPVTGTISVTAGEGGTVTHRYTQRNLPRYNYCYSYSQ